MNSLPLVLPADAERVLDFAMPISPEEYRKGMAKRYRMLGKMTNGLASLYLMMPELEHIDASVLDVVITSVDRSTENRSIQCDALCDGAQIPMRLTMNRWSLAVDPRSYSQVGIGVPIGYFDAPRPDTARQILTGKHLSGPPDRIA